MKRKPQNRISILLKDQRAMLLRLASIKLWHLAQPHVNFDSGDGTRRGPRVSSEDCAKSFKR